MNAPAVSTQHRAGVLNKLLIVWRAMRPEQWTKNLVVAAPFFFALGDSTQVISYGLSLHSVAATLLFCLLSSGVYLFNDLMDIDADRSHPKKRFRPIAAGELPARRAWTLAFWTILSALVAGTLMSRPLGFYMSLYLSLQFAYTLWLKKAPFVDIVSIAAGFVLRALAGAAAVDIKISFWLVTCTFLLAAFLGLCKRRHEKVMTDGGRERESRLSLAGYRRDIIDRLIVAFAIAVIAAYTGYALSPETARKFGDHRLIATLPFVVFGVGRYLILVFRHNLGDQPEKILLKDWPMWINITLYGLAVLVATLWLS